MDRSWWLLGDVGGTHARFAVGTRGAGELHAVEQLAVADYPGIRAALGCYLDRVRALGGWAARPEGACIAVACPADGDLISFTNSDWRFDRAELAAALGVDRVRVINDFEAVGHAVPGLVAGDWVQVGEGDAIAGRPVAVLGPGTGLGVCALVPAGGGYRVIAGEGGHGDFAPVDATEIEILRSLQTRYPHVSVERLLSGAGLVTIYHALAQQRGMQARRLDPAAVSAAAVAGDDTLAVDTLALFCRVLGSVAGNLALTFGARGGVYVAGGIVPRIVDFVQASDFRERFVAKGRFRGYLEAIPTRIVTRDSPGLYGALRCVTGTPGN